MDLDLFDNLINCAKDNNFFSNELEIFLNRKASKNMEEEIENFREEDCIYQVVDRSENGVFLQNTRNNKVFEETSIPEELLDELETDCVLRYQNGEYVFERDLTDDFYNSFLGIKEYKEIQERFVNETNILEIDPETKFKVVNQNEEEAILEYENGSITVPNALLPFFIYEDTVLKYEDGKFEKCFEE